MAFGTYDPIFRNFFSKILYARLSRPTVEKVYQYQKYVNNAMQTFLKDEATNNSIKELIILRMNHEQQHQELL